MRPHLLGVDHVVILINDIDAAQAAWSRLGFRLTPRGHHSIGTRNHCMMFGTDYLELLSVVQPHPVTAYFSEFLARGDGAAAVAFATDDSQACWDSLRDAGIAADAPVDFSRPVEVDGGARDARFRVTQLPVDATPGCRTFLCQHFTPELVWLPPYREHPLGVTGVAGVTVAADDVDAVAAAYGRVAGVTPAPVDGGARILIGRFAIDVARPADVAARLGLRDRAVGGRAAIAALHLYVRDLDAAGRQLDEAGIASQAREGARVLAEPVSGVTLALRADSPAGA